jgi:hypothetical protein
MSRPAGALGGWTRELAAWQRRADAWLEELAAGLVGNR